MLLFTVNIRLVEIKIQHNRLFQESKGDIFLIKNGTKLAEMIFPEFKYKWLGYQFEINLLKELDFINEISNSERLSDILKNYKEIVIPKYYKKYCTNKLLVMDFEEGGSIQDSHYLKENNIDVYKVSKLLSKSFNDQIFKHGFVHADPHSGNIFVRKDSETGFKMIIFDHGLYRNLDEDFRKNYILFWRGMFIQDKELIKQSCKNLRIENYELFCSVVTNKRYDQIMNKNMNTMERIKLKHDKEEMDEIMTYANEYHKDITVILSDVREEMLLLLKTNEFLRAIDRNLKCPFNNIENIVSLNFYKSLKLFILKCLFLKKMSITVSN